VVGSEPVHVLCVTTFRPRERWQELDQHLREDVMPRFAAQAGFLMGWAARRGPDLTEHHAVASVWASREAESSALTVPDLLAAPPEDGSSVLDAHSEVLAVVTHESFVRDQPMTILRVYRGIVADGRLEEYVERARRGALEDGARPDGPGAVVMGVTPPSRFVTITTWPDWPAIEVATGGDVTRPRVTRDHGLLVEGAPTHYELLVSLTG
jgi:hypothetical protein